ncbi:TolC family protein [Francisella philomiragia]|uniref:TolC family protein n=1 Tax=Francisella philomiragia TaxID=28110 RepID=UPI0019062CE7|nr:TolC family protein [Francisella philomiragia]MBK2256014.1 TolC family protein [Francisella philomiragia]MBK2268672.1 TolC family protein [Francisella philomiragia]MBK2270853.1 TolC family protein [Francisella philomiragia]MBK2274633.1 TolC family protein [Francisella philomiragia]MBK2294227.1 TolC family protein [Francisella philomiragia]
MKRLYRHLLVFIGIFGSCISAAANTVADYTDTVKQSIQNSPQYKFIGFQLDSRQMNPTIQLGRLLPSIDIGGSIKATNILDQRTMADGDIAGGRFDSIKGLVSLTQPLYDYGAYKDLQSAQEVAQFAQQDYRTNYQQFLYDTSYAYFNLAKAIKNVEYTSYNLKANKQSLNELESKFKAGTADIADYETVKANYYIAEASYAAAQREERVARAELRKFTNNDDDVVLYSNDFKIKEPSPNTEEGWEELTMRSSPSYLGSMHTKESNYYNYQSATSSFMPKVNFEVKYSPGFNDVSSLGNPVFDNFLPSKGTVNAFYFGINLTWNIFAGGTNYAELKKAAYDYQSSEFDMIQTGRVAQNDAMYAFRFVELKKKEIESLRKSVAAAKIAYEKYKERYDQGTTTITQYFILLNNYYQFLIQLNNTEFDYIMGFLSLYKTAGIFTSSTVQDFNNWLILNQDVEL